MKEPLDLSFSSFETKVIVPSEELKAHGYKLLLIPNIREKLQYYNQHICSLTYSSSEGLYCFGSYDVFHGVGEMFFSKAYPNSNPEFEIYLEERQKEINRLKKTIERQNTYSTKLKCFIEEKAGQVRFDREDFKVENNEWEKFIANGAGTHPKSLNYNYTEIDLRPSTSEERKIYNQYLYNYVQQLIKEPQKLHWLLEVSYDGFLSIQALEAFKKQVGKALNKEATIKAEIKRIEKKFHLNSLTDYIKMLYPYKINNLELWQSALFNAFVNGYEFDFSKNELSVHEMKAFIHVEQIYDYYKEVPKVDEPVEVTSMEDLLAFFESSGELIRPSKIQFNNDGTNRILAWDIGKSKDELYREEVENIDKRVENLEARCYSKLDNDGLKLLALNLKEVIYLYKYKIKAFKGNPEYKKKIEEHSKLASIRLECLLNDVVLPKIEYRNEKVKANEDISSENTKNSQRGKKGTIIKTFPEYLMHPRKELLADHLKANFITEKGKGIRLMIEALVANKILATENRQRNDVFVAVQTYFNRNIGTYQSVWTSYKFDLEKDKPDFEAIKMRVDFILQSISDNK